MSSDSLPFFSSGLEVYTALTAWFLEAALIYFLSTNSEMLPIHL